MSEFSLFGGNKGYGVCADEMREPDFPVPRNGNLLFTLLLIQKVIDQFYERQLSALEQAAAQQRAEKSGVEFVPSTKDQSA